MPFDFGGQIGYNKDINLRKGVGIMKEYEILVETINPCGGATHAKKEFIEAEAESPESYVQEHGRFPVLERIENPNGDVTIVTGDAKGYLIRYTFTE